VTQVRDVVVVGAGVIGCAVAYELARRGSDVLVMDPRGVGQGATQASAGMLTPYIEGYRKGALLDLAVRSLALYDQFIADVCADSDRRVPYERNGSLEVSTADDSIDRLQNIAKDLTAANVRCTLLDAAETHDAEPLVARDVSAGLLIPEHGYLVARDFTQALAAAATKRGAAIGCVRGLESPGTAAPGQVLRLVSAGRDLRVETDESAVVARHVVLAAGCWSGGVAIEGVPSVPVRPVRGQLLHLARSGQPVRRITWSPRCYIVPLDDGSMLVGATVEEAGFDERATVAGVRDLLDAACELVPQTWRAGFLGARVGLRPGTPDALPIVGSSERIRGLVYATGHYRNGVLLAPLTAKLVSDLLIEGRCDPALAVMSPDRFDAAA
jgi:glycine oxidase